MTNKTEIQTKQLVFPFKIKEGSFDETNPDYYEFSGYGSTFGNVDLVGDVVMPGAFTRSLSQSMPKMLWSHNRDMPIGVFIEASEDAMGLFLKGRLPKSVSMSKDAGELIKFGAVDSMSIGFRIVKADTDQDGITYIRDVDLREVSIVAIPANPLARVINIKNDDNINDEFNNDAIKQGVNTKKYRFPIDIEFVKGIKCNRDLEEFLRESGVFSKSAATLLAGRFNYHPRSESVGVGKETFDYKGLHEKLVQMAKLL